MDGRSWCSLDEIAPLSQLRYLILHGLEKVSASLLAKKATISSKGRLSYLRLHCSSDKYMRLTDEIEKQQQQRAIEKVFNNLCPPSCIENLGMKGGYFGRRLPNWMMAPATAAFESLRYLDLDDLPCCTHLPSGLCQLPSLDVLIIKSAPAIKSVGPEFMGSTSLAVGEGGVVAATSAAFPKLRILQLDDLSQWKEWVWEDVTADAMAMPSLECINIDSCKLSRLPPGLANGKRRHALTELNLYGFINLTYVENFPSVVDLDVFDCPKLKRISGLSRLQKIRILRCPNLEVLEGIPALDSMELQDNTMETLPGYLRSVNPRYLDLGCGKKLCESLLSSGSSSEWDKISHIRTRNIYELEDED
ncbi:uncharacterized protein LOC133886549 [Phragmites australis]|uniref:uncharacterized protein LOC133886549 n=1 Tax=Phragmites australis TaxID=29695 RepID=UPI002D78A2B9|nr:uncharacterized protein LOC133886549 [Phragmites australis]